MLVDALHVARGGSTPAAVQAVDPRRVRHAQLYDAHGRIPDTPEGLVAEARQRRLLPGEGQLPLRALLQALPRTRPFLSRCQWTARGAQTNTRSPYSGLRGQCSLRFTAS